MLSPENRHLLLDALRPPPRSRLDQAVGTSFTLDLLTLMTVPLAMAMYDRQGDDGTVLNDPVTTLQALRQHAGNITLFCQAGQISVPAEYRKLLIYLEDCVYPVMPPRHEGIFHPKVWFIRYLDTDEQATYRLLCLSRNLSFSRSWDTLLQLNGTPGETERWSELTEFVEALPRMAEPTRPLSPERANAVRRLGVEIASVKWNHPEGFDRLNFVPMGHDGEPHWPFPQGRRMFVVSPFVTEDAIQQLTARSDRSVLVSRPESLDALGGEATGHLAERLVLAPDAAVPDGSVARSGTNEAVAESTDGGLSGLHAKLFVADEGNRTRYWTGSANATGPAFALNVEFLVELGGRTRNCGIDVLLRETKDRSHLGLRNILEPYTPPNLEPADPDDAERLLQRLEHIGRRLGGLRYTVDCAPVAEDRWRLRLAGKVTRGQLEPATFDGVEIDVRPLTVGDGFAKSVDVLPHGLTADFQVSTDAVTPFFVVRANLGAEMHATLITAELVNPPPDRAERVLTSILSNRADLIRFLLLLLDDTEVGMAAMMGSIDEPEEPQAGSWLSAMGSSALLEPMIRAFARDPQRLREVERVIAEIGDTEEARQILPQRWFEIWKPIAAELNLDRTP